MDLIPGLEKQVRLILERRIGQENAILRSELLRQVRLSIMLVHATDRQMRQAIENLRGQRIHICNLLTGDGYYLAASMEEYQEFRRKYAAYAFSILAKVRAMDIGAEERWGYSALQPSLLSYQEA